ncbi:regucalcin [Sistotremastrum niveocremeum HHB9708]|uniref:Regucalcin n=1 Tax=Sistotremastrum niveocremeum HHB9708 TaxID=1314777 RepID=A0A164UQ46_9AGAM|nr:regucalcin [Sistotremastrum niveocremeum HHB9708]
MSHPIITVENPLIEVGCDLGEGPLYEPETGILHFVDITRKQLLHYNTVTSDLEIDQFEESIGCLALRTQGGLACAAQRGFALIEPGPSLHYLALPLPAAHAPFTRFNDGACDSEGRFFAGTLEDDEQGVPGELYRYDPIDQSCVVVDTGMTDSNGLGWTAHGSKLYFTDSKPNIIYAYDYDQGKLSNRRVFVDAAELGFANDGSTCDGLCIDSEGGVWSARWQGSRILRFAPDGTVSLEIHFPKVWKVTCCTFGGPHNDQLYVTTAHCASMGGDAGLQEKYPQSGHLFKVDFAGKFKGGPYRGRFPL